MIINIIYILILCAIIGAYLLEMDFKQKTPLLIKVLIFILMMGCGYYIFHPAINIHAKKFWIFFIAMIILFISLFIHKNEAIYNKKGELIALPFSSKVCLGVIGGLIIFYVLLSIIYSPFFNANKYATRITVTDVDFSQIPSYQYNETAIIDRNSAVLLGDKVMGQMSDLVSQFDVSDEYSQISYQNGTYRVTPLAYNGFIKYLKNNKEGIPGYIIVNTTTGETQLVRDHNMHYVPSAYFNNNLYRILQFRYPTSLFGSPTFEIDEDGNPYYVCSTYTYSGFRSLKKVTGAILFNPVDGSSEKYDLDSIPNWVDRVYPESLINTELNDYGQYQKGFWNSIFGQSGVIQTSEGYNYISKDGDIWLYTGMTSASSDDSNLGFMLVNLRTHEAEYTSTSGASEKAAMSSAEGEVLNYGYTATFPTLINVANKPIYLLSLKDSAGLVKMYALVDAQDYQQVYTTKASSSSETAISELLKQIGDTSSISTNSDSKTITINSIEKVMIDGNTFIYIKNNNDIYKVQLTEDNASDYVFLKTNDTITIEYFKVDKENTIINIK